MDINTTDKIVETVMWKLKTRSEIGITKYNTTLILHRRWQVTKVQR